MCVAGLKEPNVLNGDHLRRAFSVHFEGYGSQQMVSYDPIWTYFGVKIKKIRVCLYMGSIIFKLHIYFDYYQGYSDNILCRFSFVKGPRNKQRYRLISHSFVNRLTDLNSSILTMPMRSFSSISTNTSFHWSSLNTTGTCNSRHNFFYHGNWSSRFDRNELCNISPYLRFDETKQAR